MRKGLSAVLLIMTVVLIGMALLPIASSAEENDPFNVNTAVFWADFPSSGGTCYIDLYVQNVSNETEDISVSLWDKYTYPDGGSKWINPDWITSITPNSLILQPGQNALFSVGITLDSSVNEDYSYITWIKVTDGVRLEKPITVWIRKGKAVPAYDFSLTVGSYYFLTVSGGPNAHLAVDDPTDKENSPIGIRSKTATNTKFWAAVESPSYDDKITQDRVNDPKSSLFYGKQSEVGNNYVALSEEAANKWLKIGTSDNWITKNNPLQLKPYAVGYLPWSLTIPDDTPNGHYWLWIHVMPAEAPGQSISIDYISKMYITIDRSASSSKGFWSSHSYIAIMLGTIGVLGVARAGIEVRNVIISRRKKAKK